jgi:hypothetical protein
MCDPIENILRAARVNRRIFYRHFACKEVRPDRTVSPVTPGRSSGTATAGLAPAVGPPVSAEVVPDER